MYQNTSQETVRLYHDDTTLIGKYSEGVGTVMVELYSDIREFSVQLPSFATEYQTQFLFKNLGANAVTLTTNNNQIINQSGVTSHVVSASEFYSILSNGIDRWISLDNHLYTAAPVVFGTAVNNTTIEADGTIKLKGAARVWLDAIGDVLTLRQSGPGVSSNIAENTVEFTTAANLSDYMYANIQLNHDRDLTYLIVHPHIHWFQDRSTVPNFLIQYRFQVNGSAKTTAWTNYKCNTVAIPYVSGTINQICYGSGLVVPTTNGLSDIVQIRVLRDNANTSTVFAGADPFNATVGTVATDIHYLANTLGSNDKYVK